LHKPQTDLRAVLLTGVFAAFIAIMAQVSIPMPLGVPLTLQTFAVAMAGILLGANQGFWAALAYILLGAAGAPVFAGFRGGVPCLLGPTGGFLLSFPLLAWLSGLGTKKSRFFMACGIAAGVFVNYACGLLLFAVVTKDGFERAFLACAAPFLPLEAVKMVLAWVLGVRIRVKVGKILPS